MRAPACPFFLLALVGCARGEKPQPAAQAPAAAVPADTGFKTPESVLYDAAAEVYLVSNIHGNPLAKDNNGFIARVSPEGDVVAARWIVGGRNQVTLHAPKGMAIKGDTLFVADIDAVRVFDRTTGAPLGSREISGAGFLNDVAVGPDGTVYVTDSGLKSGPDGFADSGTDAIYRFGADGKASALAQGASLGRPNGITATAAGIVVVTFGSGEVYRLDPVSGSRTTLPKPPKGRLDGVEQLPDSSLLISSWEGQAVYQLRGTAYRIAVDSVDAPADIGYDRKRGVVLIPLFNRNAIQVRPVR